MDIAAQSIQKTRRTQESCMTGLLHNQKKLMQMKTTGIHPLTLEEGMKTIAKFRTHLSKLWIICQLTILMKAVEDRSRSIKQTGHSIRIILTILSTNNNCKKT